MNMEKFYVVIASGESSKKTGKPYTIAKALVDLKTSQFLSDKDQKFFQECHPVGTKIIVNEEVNF